MRLSVLVLVVAAACSSKADQPRGTESASLAQATPTRASGDLLFLPKAVAERLGDSELVIAIDFTKLELARVFASYPQFACVGDVTKSLGVVAVTGQPWIAFATNLAPPAAGACIEKLGRDLGLKTTRTQLGSYTIGSGAEEIFLSWDDDVAILRSDGRPPPRKGPQLPEVHALAKHVPSDAALVLIKAHGWPEKNLENAVAWFSTIAGTLHVVVRVEGAEPGVVGPWLEGVAGGFKTAATAKQVAVDDSWLKMSVVEPIGTLEAKVPVSALVGLASPLGQ
jgi:hypothetical protein